jgi:hypothetical protein
MMLLVSIKSAEEEQMVLMKDKRGSDQISYSVQHCIYIRG